MGQELRGLPARDHLDHPAPQRRRPPRSCAWHAPSAAMAAGGLFNTQVSGTGSVAVLCLGAPPMLPTDEPVCVDRDATLAWTAGVRTRMVSTFRIGNLVGRSSGERAQIEYTRRGGFVVVQCGEVPAAGTRSSTEQARGAARRLPAARPAPGGADRRLLDEREYPWRPEHLDVAAAQGGGGVLRRDNVVEGRGRAGAGGHRPYPTWRSRRQGDRSWGSGATGAEGRSRRGTTGPARRPGVWSRHGTAPPAGAGWSSRSCRADGRPAAPSTGA